MHGGPLGFLWVRRGYSTVAVHQLPKLATRVRFPRPSPAPRRSSGRQAWWAKGVPHTAGVRPTRLSKGTRYDIVMRLLFVVALALTLSGCETVPQSTQFRASVQPAALLPTLEGSTHHVRHGETLWRIARSYGLDVDTLAAANRLPDTTRLDVGQELFIPLPPDTQQFLWPVRGELGRTGSAVEIAAPAGSLVRASRSGRVAVATHRLSGWGKAVILDHLDGHLTVYAGLDQLLTSPGAHLRQGVPLGSLSSRALHFEIRYGTAPKDTLALLPSE